jgi:cytochrome c
MTFTRAMCTGRTHAECAFRAVVAVGEWLLFTAVCVCFGQIIIPASADPIGNGKAAFAACSACHSTTGLEDSGPHLNGLLGRKAGSVPRFNYSSAMKNASIVWDSQTLDRFLANPQEQVPGNRMPFTGLADSAKRTDLIGYLATLK